MLMNLELRTNSVRFVVAPRLHLLTDMIRIAVHLTTTQVCLSGVLIQVIVIYQPVSRPAAGISGVKHLCDSKDISSVPNSCCAQVSKAPGIFKFEPGVIVPMLAPSSLTSSSSFNIASAT